MDSQVKQYPKGFDGRQTTKEEWDAYNLAKLNHDARIKQKKEYLQAIIKRVMQFGAADAHTHFTNLIDQEWAMDAPNEPGYYRANND